MLLPFVENGYLFMRESSVLEVRIFACGASAETLDARIFAGGKGAFTYYRSCQILLTIEGVGGWVEGNLT